MKYKCTLTSRGKHLLIEKAYSKKWMLNSNIITIPQHSQGLGHWHFPWILSHQDGWEDLERIPVGTDDFKDFQRSLSTPNANTLRSWRKLRCSYFDLFTFFHFICWTTCIYFSTFLFTLLLENVILVTYRISCEIRTYLMLECGVVVVLVVVSLLNNMDQQFKLVRKGQKRF